MRQEGAVSGDTKAEAALWLARLHADDRTAIDEQAFQAWLNARPENARAFEAVTALWDLADGLRAESAAPARSGLTIRRRTIIAGAGTLLASAAGFAVWEEAYAGVYETDVGEMKHVRLSDGTQVFLDTDTRIRERYSRSLRRVELHRGRANLRVRPDAERPFVVDAAAERVLADRTTFDVRRDGNRVSVVLLEGRASVLTDVGAATRRLMLSRGQRLVVAEDRTFRIDTPDLASVTAWQSGQVIFEGETLAAAIAEMNRYSAVRLELNDPAVARLKLSGVYRVGDNEAFARSVSQLLPVSIEHYPDHIDLVRDPSRMPEG